MTTQPNLLVILIDDLRFDEFGAGGHPYMTTPHIDRIANDAHKAVHPDAEQAADGTFRMDDYRPAERHKDMYRGCVFPRKPNMLAPADVLKSKPAWADLVVVGEVLQRLHRGIA